MPRFSALPRMLVATLFVACSVFTTDVATTQAQPSDGNVTVAQVAAESNNVRLLGQIGGNTEAIYVVGTRAYVGIGPRLVVLDVADPVQPVVLGATFVLPGYVTDVVVVDNVAYVTDGMGLAIIDVTNPASPSELGYYDTPGWARGVFVVGTTAHVADSWSGLRIINVANPARPSELGFYDTPGYAYSVYVVGTTAYVADTVGGLRIINVANPASPSELGFYDALEYAYGLYVVGTTAYVADWGSGLRIIDVANPASPSELGFYDTPGWAHGVFVVGTTAYVAHSGSGLRIIDVADPSSPSELGFYDALKYAEGVDVVGTTAYVTDSGTGLRIIDVANPASPSELGFYHTLGYSTDVFVVGTTAYVADWGGGLRIINVANPASPSELGFYDALEYAEGVDVVGTTAYVADRVGGLRIINVANPARPSELGFYDTPGWAHGVFVVGTTAYVADSGSGLRIIDVANPASPSELGFYDALGYAVGVYVVGTTAYVADLGSGLRIINVANPASPSGLGFYDTPGDANSVFVVGTTAYVADGQSGLRIINVANPSSPSELGFYDTSGNASDVYVVGTTAYVADWGSGLRIIDVANPASPSELGFYDIRGGTMSVFVAGTTTYVGDATGLYILKYPPCYSLVTSHTGSGTNPVATPANHQGCKIGEYLFGDLISLSATPDPTWRVANWVGTNNDNTMAKTNLLTMPAADVEVTVNYVPTCYTLVLGHTGPGNDPSLSPASSDGCIPGQYIAGQLVTLTASPNAGYIVNGWTGTANDSSTDPQNSFTMPAANHAAGVTYAPGCYPLTLIHSGSGGDPTASPAQSSDCTTNQYHLNENVNLSASPASGWYVSSWSGTSNNAITSTTNSLIMPPNATTVSVNYGEIPIAGPGDSFETDNSCTRYRSIDASSGEVQNHSFHAIADEDWVGFIASEGVTYRIEVTVPDNSPADVGLEVYKACGGAVEAIWQEAFAPGARLDFKPTASGPIYVRLSNTDANVAGDNVQYQVAVRTLESANSNRALIIVAGRLKGSDPVQKNIDNVASEVYRAFQKNGFGDDSIYFLSTKADQPGRTADATKSGLRAAITDWAKQRLKAGGVLTLYMVDHGNSEVFYIDNLRNDSVSPAELDAWLSELEAAIPDLKLNVFIETCSSGSFINDNPTLDGKDSISKNGRVIVSSSNVSEDAKVSKDGANFSDHFLTWLQQGYNLAVDFDEASQVAKSIYALQLALLDADGDGKANEYEDSQLAARRSFAYAGTLGDNWAPHIFSVTGSADIGNFRGTFQADVRDDVNVREVWALIYPPDYVPPPATQQLQEETLTTLLLTRKSDGRSYDGFTQYGTYRIVVQADDNEGLKAKPVAIEIVTGGEIYLPLISR